MAFFWSIMTLESKRLYIRPFLQSDGKDLHDYLKREEIYRYEPGEPLGLNEAKDLAMERSKSRDFLGVILKRTNKLIGHLYWHQVEPQRFQTWELGFIFNPKYHNQGYCTEACSILLEDQFEQKKIHKAVAFCNPENLASWKVLEKLAMSREGHFKQKAFFRKDPQGSPLWFDCYAYGKLNCIDDKNRN